MNRVVFWAAGFCLFGAAVAAIDVYPFLDAKVDRGQIFGRDFLPFWAAGSLLNDGMVTDIYSIDHFNNFLKETVSSALGDHTFAYPPQALVFFSLLGDVSYDWGLALWTIAGLTGYGFAVGSPDWSRVRVLLALAAPTTFFCVALGQISLLMAALFIGGVRLLESRPIWAGVLFGLLTIKPHLGVLVPIALIAGGYWRTFLSAAITTLVLVAISIVIWGIPVWLDFLDQGVKQASLIILHFTGKILSFMISPFMGARQLGLDPTAAGIIQAAFALFAAVSVARVFYKSRDEVSRLVVLAAATFLVSPYAIAYDLTVLSGALVFLFVRGQTQMGLLQMLALFAWALPIIGPSLAGPWLPLFAPFVLLALILACHPVYTYGRNPIPSLDDEDPSHGA